MTERPKSLAQASLDSGAPRTDDINDGTCNRNPEGIGVWALIREDFHTNGSTIWSPGFWALFWHRFGNWRMSLRPKALRAPFSLLYKASQVAVRYTCGIELPYTTPVGRRLTIEHFGGMILVARAIGDDVLIRQNTTFGIKDRHTARQRPTIGDAVELGTGTVVLGDVVLGKGCRIGANAVVLSDVPAGATAVGLPARVVCPKPKPLDVDAVNLSA